MCIRDRYNSASSQAQMYYEDGLFVTQWGWRGSSPIRHIGYANQAPPGYAGNIQIWSAAQYGGDIYQYVADEAVHGGVQRFHLTNLSSVHELSGTSTLGGSISLTPLF